MKTYQETPTYPILRRHFKSYKQLGQVINRSESYINNCLNGRNSFTRLEKSMILHALALPATPDIVARFFPEVKR